MSGALRRAAGRVADFFWHLAQVLRWCGRNLVRLVWWGGLAVAVLLACTGLALAAAGQWWHPAPAERAAHHTKGAGGSAGTGTGADTSAASEVLAALAAVGDGTAGLAPDGASRTTLRSAVAPRCSGTAPYLSWGRTLRGPGGPVVVGAEVHGAGLGGRALEARRRALSRCGVRTRPLPGRLAAAVAGAPGTLLAKVGDTTELAWRRGDVVVVVDAFSPAAPLGDVARALDEALVRALDGRCAEAGAPESAARRNPSQPDFSGLVRPEQVAGPADVPAPSPSDLAAPAPSVPAAAPGTVTAAPSPPQEPRPPATSVEVQVRTTDTDGPGCGWEFAGTPAPRQDPRKLEDAADKVRAAARDRLAGLWREWQDQAARYREARARFAADQAEYTAWAATTTTTTTTVPTTTSTTSSTTTTVPTTTTTSSTTTTTVPTTTTVAR